MVMVMVSSTPCGVAVVVGASTPSNVAVVDNGFIHPLWCGCGAGNAAANDERGADGGLSSEQLLTRLEEILSSARHDVMYVGMSDPGRNKRVAMSEEFAVPRILREAEGLVRFCTDGT